MYSPSSPYLYAAYMTQKKFTQIAFSFDEVALSEAPVQEPLPVAEPETPVTAQELPVIAETAPVNVGFRVKALKAAAAPPAVIMPAPAPVSVAVAVAEPPKVKVKSTRGRKSLKAVETEAALVNIPEDEVLFRKQYYSIGEVAGMFHVNTSLIRYWANEFEMIQPRTNRKGDRHFRPVDIKNLLLIHDLLRRRKLTIEGAKDFLKKNKKAQERHELIESLRRIRSFFLEVKARL